MSSDAKLGTAELLYRCAENMGLQPSWLTPQGALVIVIDGRETYIHFARSPLNSHIGISLANNKYVTRLIMERHGLPNIPFALPRTQADAASFLTQYQKIIAKPVRGSGAKDIHIITEPSQLEGLRLPGYIFEKYIAGKEMRYLVLNESIIGVHQSEYGVSVEETRALRRLSFAAPEWDPELIAMSLRIADILPLKFAAIDYMITDDGQVYILEVNSTPGLKWFHAPTSGPIVDVARLFLESIVDNQQAALRLPEDTPYETDSLVVYS